MGPIRLAKDTFKLIFLFSYTSAVEDILAVSFLPVDVPIVVCEQIKVRDPSTVNAEH